MTPPFTITDWELGFWTGVTVGIIAGLLIALAIAYVPEVARRRSLKERTCRVCGCTDSDACVNVDNLTGTISTCAWVAADLCSRCAVTLEERRIGHLTVVDSTTEISGRAN